MAINNSLSFMIFMTRLCNLKCRYCYEQNIEKDLMTNYLSEETMVDIIIFIKKSVKEKDIRTIFITFHGGEPLINYSLIEKTVNCISNDLFFTDIEVIYGMTSNGMLMSDDIAIFISNHIANFSLSIDGTPEIHDSMRIDAFGVGSYEKVKSSAKKILKYKPDTKARMTVNSKTITEFWSCLNSITEMGFHEIVPVIDIWDKGWNEENTKLIGIYNEKILSEGSNDIIIEPFIDKSVKKKKCSGGEYNFCITTDGDIFPCVCCVGEDKYCYGNVSSEIDYKVVKFVEECKKIRIEECFECENYFYCNGVRCIFLNERYSGTIQEVIPMLCFLEHLKLM